MKHLKINQTLSLILKLIVIVFATMGVLISAGAGRHSFMGGSTVFMYFTIQSNIAIAIICLIGGYYLLAKKKMSDRWYVIKYVGTIAITVTGAVFCFVLAPTMGRFAWTPANVYTHVIVPVVSVLDFFVIGLDSNIKKSSVVYLPIPPILYAIYAGIGYVLKWEFSPGVNYPYFFLNWGSPLGAFGFGKELPFMGCVWWILLLFVLIILVGFIYLFILDGLKKVFRKK